MDVGRDYRYSAFDRDESYAWLGREELYEALSKLGEKLGFAELEVAIL